MKEYEEKFGYANDDEDEDAISAEAFLDGFYSAEYEEFFDEPETKHLITQVFTEDCAAMEPKEAYEKLVDIIKNEPKNKRAWGSLGGAVKNGFLKYDKKTNLFIKIG